jgi:hypothetical protein
MEYIASAIILGMAVLCQWFLSTNVYEQSEEILDIPKGDHLQRQKLILLLLDLVFLLAALVSPQMSVMWRWSLRFLCWVITVVLVQLHFEKPKKGDLKACVTIVAGFLFFASFHMLIQHQWMEERSLLTSGYLCSRFSEDACYTPPIPIIEIGGDSGSKFIYAGAENSVDFGRFARNVGLRIERGPTGMEISTPILDRSEKRIANIEKNHWTVLNQPEILDKNYNDNALEIIDSRGEVVLQLRYLPDRLQIAAEWRDQFGRGQEWAKCAAPGKPPTGCVIPWGDPRTELQNEVPIEPIFQYPSREHLGEFVKKE